MSKKKQLEKASNKIVYIFFIVGLVILLLLGFLYYQSQRPNYRDLEKAFNELSIPEDWQQVSVSGNRGTWGLFCWQIEGEACPYKTIVFSRGIISHYDMLQTNLKSIEQRLIESGYAIKNSDQTYCGENEFNNSDYLCSISAEKDGKEVYIAYRSSDASQVKGDFVSITISRSD